MQFFIVVDSSGTAWLHCKISIFGGPPVDPKGYPVVQHFGSLNAHFGELNCLLEAVWGQSLEDIVQSLEDIRQSLGDILHMGPLNGSLGRLWGALVRFLVQSVSKKGAKRMSERGQKGAEK